MYRHIWCVRCNFNWKEAIRKNQSPRCKFQCICNINIPRVSLFNPFVPLDAYRVNRTLFDLLLLRILGCLSDSKIVAPTSTFISSNVIYFDNCFRNTLSYCYSADPIASPKRVPKNRIFRSFLNHVVWRWAQ